VDVGRRHAGAVSGAMNMAGQAAGAVCTALYAYLVAWGGSDELPMLVFAIHFWISAVLFALINPTRPLIPDHEETAGEPACD